MLIALLAVLGVDLTTIVVLVVVLLTRRAWVSHQPGSFKGTIRVADGDVPRLRRKWKRGFGRWVGDVLVWTKAPLLFWNELVEADRMAAETREAAPGDKVKRLGSGPVIVSVSVADGGARVEIATAADHQERALGLFAKASGGTHAGNRASAPTGRHAQPSATGDSRSGDAGPT